MANKLAMCVKGCPGCGMMFGPCDPFEQHRWVVIPYGSQGPKGFDTEEEAVKYRKELLEIGVYSMHSPSKFYEEVTP